MFFQKTKNLPLDCQNAIKIWFMGDAGVLDFIAEISKGDYIYIYICKVFHAGAHGRKYRVEEFPIRMCLKILKMLVYYSQEIHWGLPQGASKFHQQG